MSSRETLAHQPEALLKGFHWNLNSALSKWMYYTIAYLVANLYSASRKLSRALFTSVDAI